MSDEIWQLEVYRNPEGARYVWGIDIMRDGLHFREVEHNSREIAIRIALGIVEGQNRELVEEHRYSKRQKVRGLILGLAVGDAIGAVVEKSSVEETRAYIKEHVVPSNYGDNLKSTFEYLPFGHYTDDTQMARELLLSMVDSDGAFDPSDYAAKLASLFEEGRIVGSGGTTRRAVKRLIEGTAWTSSGEASSAGNGSAMRVAPLGLIEDFNEMVKAAVDQSRITHTHPTSIVASVVVAHMVHQAFYESHEKTPLQMLQSVYDSLWGPGKGYSYLFFGSQWGEEPELEKSILKSASLFRRGVGRLSDLITEGAEPERVRNYIIGLQDETTWEGISPYALSSVLWSLYAFATCPDDYGKLIETALWPAGDVDTIAAMAGAMWGARNGSGGLPEPVVSKLNDGGEWRAKHLGNLADYICHVLWGLRVFPPNAIKYGAGVYNPSDKVRLRIKDGE